MKDWDFRVLPDYPNTNKEQWISYREQLRDFPAVWIEGMAFPEKTFINNKNNIIMIMWMIIILCYIHIYLIEKIKLISGSISSMGLKVLELNILNVKWL